MAMSLGPSDNDDDNLHASINTTPLVDVMLVLLIIFLITIPVVTHTVPVSLPRDRNTAAESKPSDINIAVRRDGSMYWNETPIAGIADLNARLRIVGQQTPLPAVHIRGDQDSSYDAVGQVLRACKDAGITKIGFITEPR